MKLYEKLRTKAFLMRVNAAGSLVCASLPAGCTIYDGFYLHIGIVKVILGLLVSALFGLSLFALNWGFISLELWLIEMAARAKIKDKTDANP